MAEGTTTGVQADHQELTEQLLELADTGRMDETEALWLERIEEIPAAPTFIREWLKRLRKASALPRAEALLAMLAEARLDAAKPKAAMRVLVTAIPVYPLSEPLRPLLRRALAAVYSDIPDVERLLEHVGLSGGGSLVESYKNLADWLRVAPGQVYQHTDWGEGIVRSLDPASGRVTIDFPGHPARELTVEGVRKHLRYIEPGHFLALRATDPASLSRLAETDPSDLVRRILACQEKQTLRQADLKALIIGGVVEPGDWNSWWGRAREALKLDPFIDFDASGGARANLRLRERPRSIEEEIEEAFFASDATIGLRAELIRRLVRHAGGGGVGAALAGRMARLLIDHYQLADEPVARFELASMLADLRLAAPGAAIDTPEPTADLASLTDYDLLCAVEHVDHGIRALTYLLERDGPEGCRLAAALLPRAPVRLAQSIWEALDREHHIEDAVRAIEVLLSNPLDNRETWAWAVRAILDGSWGHLEDYFPIRAIVPEILDYMEEWYVMIEDGDASSERTAAAKTLLTRMRTLVGADHCSAIVRALNDMNREAAVRLRKRVEHHPAFPSSFRAQADRAIRQARPELEEDLAAEAAAAPATEVLEEAHYCTQRAFNQKAAELREITGQKIPNNAKVIEEARMEGDLRENAGYQYAKEEQKMLVQTQATLSALLSRARVVSASQVDTSKIGFGTRFTARNVATGGEEQYTVLGRWEADPERHILSRQAPMAVQFMGRVPGDKVTIEHPGGGETPYEILSIENALATGDWDN